MIISDIFDIDRDIILLGQICRTNYFHLTPRFWSLHKLKARLFIYRGKYRLIQGY
jgi:hypothetical protein